MRSTDDATRTEAESRQATVWICPECFDAYESRPPAGECLNPGHAAVELVATPLRAVEHAAPVLVPVAGPASVSRQRPQGGRRRPRTTRRRKTKAA